MPQSEAERRSYWAAQLDAAHAFMMTVMDYPVADCGEKLVSLPDAASAAGVDITFSEKPHVNNLKRVYVLREGQIESFMDTARRLNRRGWVLRIEDGYRSRTMQKFIGRQPYVFDAILNKVLWELEDRMPTSDFFYKRMLTLVAQIPKTGTHMSGSAVDVSVLDKATGEEVDRGGPYIEISELTPMNSPFISVQARRNREEITAIFRQCGFVEYPYEFWHYSSGDAYEQLLLGTGEPARYGAVDYDPTTGQVTEIEDPRRSLNSLEEIEAEIQAAMQRRGGA